MIQKSNLLDQFTSYFKNRLLSGAQKLSIINTAMVSIYNFTTLIEFNVYFLFKIWYDFKLKKNC